MERISKYMSAVVRQLRILWVVAAASSVVSAEARTERNSFLEWPANSPASLGRQVKMDYRVSDRFERHFRMSQEETIAYLSNLHLTRLTKTQSFQMYSALPDGRLKMRPVRLKKGTLVFADAKGTPILRAKCANPIAIGKEFPRPKHEPEAASSTVDEKLTLEHNPVSELTPEPLLLGVEPSLPTEEIAQIPSSPDVEAAGPNNPIAPTLTASSGLAGLPLLGLIAIPFDGGHDTRVTSVPEISPMFALGPGVLAVSLLRRRKANPRRKR